MSVLAWITFIICAAAVALHYYSTGNERFLLYAIPGLAMLIVIPFTLAWMSRRSFEQASVNYDSKARHYRIDKIGLEMTGTVLRISGKVGKISFKWLNRPHFHINDGTAGIRVIMFTAPANEISVGDSVEVLGIVMKNIFSRKAPIISAVSVKKKDT